MSNARYLKIGEAAGQVVGYRCTLDELGKELGCSRQLAWYYSNVALGKVIHRLRLKLKSPESFRG